MKKPRLSWYNSHLLAYNHLTIFPRDFKVTERKKSFNGFPEGRIFGYISFLTYVQGDFFKLIPDKNQKN